MSARGKRVRVIGASACIGAVVLVALLTCQSLAGATAAGPTTIAAAATTAVPSAPTSAPTTTVAPTTTTAATTTTIPGPTPRASRRVASPVAIEKIRATSLPLRVMGIALGVAVAALAAAGFVYGKIRSRIPATAIPKVAVPAGPDPSGPLPSPPATSMPPPPAIPLPPPIIEDAVSDTVIFEPPPEHRPPQVIAETTATPEFPDEPENSEGSEVSDDEDGTQAGVIAPGGPR